VPVEVVWSRLAREELIELYLNIGMVHQAAAERLYDRLEQRARQLADQPRMGQRRPDIHPRGRVLVVHPYLLLYETLPDTDDGQVTAVEIVSVVDGRRDLATEG